MSYTLLEFHSEVFQVVFLFSFGLALVHSLNVKTVLFQTTQFSISAQFKHTDE